MKSSEFGSCPRCGDKTLEVLETHTHCASCLYSPDVDVAVEPPSKRPHRIEKEFEDEDNGGSVSHNCEIGAVAA